MTSRTGTQAAPRRGSSIPRGSTAARSMPVGRLVLLALGGACLLTGLNAGLLLADVWAPVQEPRLENIHGVVMVLGFLGTVISLERAQAYRQAWGYLAPAILAAGGLALAVGAPPQLGALLLIQGAAVFVALYVALWRRSHHPIVAVQVLSAVFALVAAVLWLWVDVSVLLAWLIGFIVLTIGAERTELAILSMGPRAPARLLGFAVALTAGAIATLLWADAGFRLFGAAVAAFAAWLAWADVARHFIHTEGLRRYNAFALLAGYVWLVGAGGVLLAGGVPLDEGAYDAVIHLTFLGFAMSMIMAHAPLIFPAVIGRPLPYRPVLWVPLLLLHVGVLIRTAGDVGPRDAFWQTGAVLTVLAVLLFLLTSVLLVVTHGSRSHDR